MAGRAFYVLLAAGIAFIVIGIASSLYSGVAVDVPLDGTLKPGLTDILTPDMNVGSKASIMVNGSTFDVKIFDPEDQVLTSESGISNFSYNFAAQKAGEHTIEIKNTGSSDVVITGHAETKGGPLGLTGPLMLIVTGIIVIGLGLRFKNR